MPIDSFESADGEHEVRWVEVARGFGSLTSYPAALDEAPGSIALVLDGFAFDLHVGDRFVATGTHDGAAFRDIAVDHGVAVYLTRNVDVRRSTPDGARGCGRCRQRRRVTRHGVRRRHARGAVSEPPSR